MAGLVAYCGIDCAKCDAYIATQDDDDAARAVIAARWAARTRRPFRPDQINCGGCATQEGRHAPYLHECPVRNCAGDRSLAHCGLCPQFPCGKLEPIFENGPAAETNLRRLQS